MSQKPQRCPACGAYSVHRRDGRCAACGIALPPTLPGGDAGTIARALYHEGYNTVDEARAGGVFLANDPDLWLAVDDALAALVAAGGDDGEDV